MQAKATHQSKNWHMFVFASFTFSSAANAHFMLIWLCSFFINAAMYFAIGIGTVILLWLIIACVRNIYYRRHCLFTIQRMLGFGICGFCCPITGCAFTIFWVKLLTLVLFIHESKMSLDCSLHYGNAVANATFTTSQVQLLEAGHKCAMTKNAIKLLPGTLQFQLYENSVMVGHPCSGFKYLSSGQSAEGCMVEARNDPDCINVISYNKRLSCVSPFPLACFYSHLCHHFELLYQIIKHVCATNPKKKR